MKIKTIIVLAALAMIAVFSAADSPSNRDFVDLIELQNRVEKLTDSVTELTENMSELTERIEQLEAGADEAEIKAAADAGEVAEQIAKIETLIATQTTKLQEKIKQKASYELMAANEIKTLQSSLASSKQRRLYASDDEELRWRKKANDDERKLAAKQKSVKGRLLRYDREIQREQAKLNKLKVQLKTLKAQQ